MGINISWDDADQTRFVYQFEASWTRDEFFVAKDRAKTMMDAVPHKFAIILDLTRVSRLPPDSLVRARNALRDGHPNAVFIVTVASDPVFRTDIGTLRDIAPISPRAVEIVPTLDEARLIAHQHLDQISAQG
jgi:hypothetical protein